MWKQLFISSVLFSLYLDVSYGMLDDSYSQNNSERGLPLLEYKDNAFVVNQDWHDIEKPIENVMTVESFCNSVKDITLLESALKAYNWLYNDIKYGWSSIKCKCSDAKKNTLDFLQQSIYIIKEYSSSSGSKGSE